MVQGQVQGVGFRPFVFLLAEDLELTGFVHNTALGVVIEVQGREAVTAAFARGLEERLPPLAKVTRCTEERIPPVPGETDFVIRASAGATEHAVLISPDMALCEDCRADMQDAANRRFAYPFTNCTNCGPRYTITRSIPYDRGTTSMACFPLCPACRQEYENPRNRRFHAQPNACPACGPVVWFVGKAGGGAALLPPGEEGCGEGTASAVEAAEGVAGRESSVLPPENREPWGDTSLATGHPRGPEALECLGAALARGKIAAVKGLGGFHLVCDARNAATVDALRRRKQRPHKPFAVMVENVEAARAFAHVSAEEAALLASQEHPILVCALHDEGRRLLAPGIAPDTATVGLMLPYTPLHQAFFTAYARQGGEKTSGGAQAQPGDMQPRIGNVRENSFPPALVMTSGNPAGAPICLGNREALAALAPLADVFLFHNRDILIRVDDSVLCCPGGGSPREPVFFRRARGYVPRPLPLGEPAEAGGGIAAEESVSRESSAVARKLVGSQVNAPCVLGVGADLKNTLCLSKGGDAFVSQHIGDMSNLETLAFHREITAHLQSLLRVRPEAVARDLHPNFLSSQEADSMGLPVLRLQHHYAHAHAVLAEHGHSGPALVLALDGTGLGEDNSLWGGELLFVHPATLEHARLAHLVPMLLPGGEAAIHEPWRIAHALLLRLGLVGASPAPAEAALCPWLPEHEGTAALLPSLLGSGFNCPASTSAGRFFDAVGAALGLCSRISYEGQAAIRLEQAQWGRALGIHETQGVRMKGEVGLPGPQEVRTSRGNDGGATAPGSRTARQKGAVYPCPILPAAAGRPLPQLDTHSLFAAVVRDAAGGAPVPLVARRFHASFAKGLAALAAEQAARLGVRHVGLSGGCLQNITLALALAEGLEDRGLVPLMHKRLPPNDACISFGQVAWARRKLFSTNGI